MFARQALPKIQDSHSKQNSRSPIKVNIPGVVREINMQL